MFRSILTTSRPLVRQPLRQFTTTAIKMGVTVEVGIFCFLLVTDRSGVHLSVSADMLTDFSCLQQNISAGDGKTFPQPGDNVTIHCGLSLNSASCASRDENLQH